MSEREVISKAELLDWLEGLPDDAKVCIEADCYYEPRIQIVLDSGTNNFGEHRLAIVESNP